MVALSVAAALAVFLLYTSIAGGTTASLRPSQLAAHKNENVQLAGLVIGPVAGDPYKGGMRFRLRDIDGKAVVITIDRNQLHVLNAVGTRVWQLMDGRSLSAIVGAIVEEFEVDRSRAASDVRAFAERLLAVGAARVGAAEG